MGKKHTHLQAKFRERIAGKKSGIGVSFSPFFSYLSWSAVRHKKTKALGICLGGGEDADAGGMVPLPKVMTWLSLNFCVSSL